MTLPIASHDPSIENHMKPKGVCAGETCHDMSGYNVFFPAVRPIKSEPRLINVMGGARNALLDRALQSFSDITDDFISKQNRVL